ncbi:leucyl/phenylalanyl-tRNA--protein transferase [uncultured Brevundimonas sp.]|uniref:leucyl/phenylalanyl-tRNA--protein transferase n=1 Tax=uncultured Brevundimonas sp. TaxID=213418 RepID=UPI0026225880|nr:leucyl/phenylalanyl-tRNA--protein transferase [uncultured Brevundimonas sp.]
MGGAPEGRERLTKPDDSAGGPFGGFGPDDLLACYARGVFPMAESRDDPRVFIIEPEQRGVIPLDGFHIPTRLRRTVRGEPFEVRVDTAFEAVLEGCAAAQGGERQDTWINDPIRRLYAALFARGFVHSIECWKDERLVGGLYGVSLGGAFFGESMFSRERDASKVALVHLVARLRKGGWTLLDAQFLTDHLIQFGAVETPQAAYLRCLKPALKVAVDDTALIAPMTGIEAVELALSPV